jgi:pentatricopeptide repeat protein
VLSTGSSDLVPSLVRLSLQGQAVDDWKRCGPDVVTYSTLISGLCGAGRVVVALSILGMMLEEECKPNAHTYMPIMHAYCVRGAAMQCEQEDAEEHEENDKENILNLVLEVERTALSMFFAPTRYRVEKIVFSYFEVVLRTMKSYRAYYSLFGFRPLLRGNSPTSSIFVLKKKNSVTKGVS